MPASTHAATDPGGLIFSDAWITAPPGHDHRDGWNLRLSQLEAKAQPEQWDDPNEPTGTLPVLSSYVRYTYARAKEEGKFVTGADDRGTEIGAFNTGLFTPRFEPILALFEANRNPGQQPWVFKDWVTLSDWRLRPLHVDALQPATYFNDPAELVYDPTRELVANLDHILVDREERWPPELPEDEVQRRIMLDGAIREVGKRVRMNWRLAVPQFYWPSGSRNGRIQLLLPLRLGADRPAHLALVVDRREDVYVGYTILTLSMAYKNARLVTRPESDWLSVAPTALSDATETDDHAAAKWRRVTAGDRCPICGEPTKCAISADNHTAVCCRVSEGGVPRAIPAGATVWIHRLR